MVKMMIAEQIYRIETLFKVILTINKIFLMDLIDGKQTKKPIVLCIMDGWGINENTANNAVALAHTPNVDLLTKTFSYATLDASGEDVGLPLGQVGNSEVGHMNLGSGRVVLQTLPKINKSFANNEIENNKNFQKFLSNHNKNKTVHLLGLCSDGGVHSHSSHMIEMSKLLKKIIVKLGYTFFQMGEIVLQNN